MTMTRKTNEPEIVDSVKVDLSLKAKKKQIISYSYRPTLQFEYKSGLFLNKEYKCKCLKQ